MIKLRQPIWKACLIVPMLLLAAGCGSSTTSTNSSANSSAGPTNSSANSSTGTPAAVKSVPDQMTKIKVGIPTQNIDYLPWYIADQKGLFKKYNLDVEFQRVEGGVVGLRGLSTGDFAFLGGLPESVINGVAEGANVKLIGALTPKSVYSVYATTDIKKAEDLKGKAAAVVQPGNGTDIILRWWLKKHGLEPDKDVRVISAGGNPARVQALTQGQAQVTLLSPPTDLQAEKLGLTKLGLIRDELPSYNHDCIAANGKILKEKPEVARAFMKATAEAMQLIKDEKNRQEVVQIGTKVLETDEQSFLKSLAFVLPSYGDQARINADGIKWAIDTVKATGALTKDVSLKDVLDESYYSQNP